MRALLRPLFVGTLGIAIALTSFVGSSSVAFAAGFSITAKSVTSPVYVGDKPWADVTFEDTEVGIHRVDIDWGDFTATDSFLLDPDTYSRRDPTDPTGPNRIWTFKVQKPVPYATAKEVAVQIVVWNSSATIQGFVPFTVLPAVPNQAPTIEPLVLTAGNEGENSTLALTFADADTADTHTVSVAWGDGSTSSPVAAEVPTFNATHVYADNGVYSVVVTLTDSAAHSVTATGSVSPTNVAPAVGALTLTPTSIVDHQTVTLSGTFIDPGTNDTFTVTIDWGDPKSSTPQKLAAGSISFTDTHTYDAAGPVTITATVADDDNGEDSASFNLVVDPSNHAPANLDVQATTPILEGGTTTLNVAFTDAEASDHTVAIVWGDGATEDIHLSPDVKSISPTTHTYAQSGHYTVAVTVTDSGGLSVSGGTTVDATNVSPSLSSPVLTPASVTDHQDVTVTGTFSDLAADDPFTLTVNWGDGIVSTQTLAAGVRNFSASHAYTVGGTYDVVVTITDRDGGAGSPQTASLFVNTAPSALTLTPVPTGANLELTGSFTDPDALDTHTVAVNWGDGDAIAPDLAAGTTTIDLAHVYAASGSYTVTVTVTDHPFGTSTGTTLRVPITVPVVTATDILDQMSNLVASFNIDRNTERWMLRRIDDLQASLDYGNGQICSGSGTLSHLMAFAVRNLSSADYATLSALSTKLQDAAGCATASVRGNPASPRNAVAGLATPPAQSTPKSSGGHGPR